MLKYVVDTQIISIKRVIHFPADYVRLLSTHTRLPNDARTLIFK